jgi:hypothetical protein
MRKMQEWYESSSVTGETNRHRHEQPRSRRLPRHRQTGAMRCARGMRNGGSWSAARGWALRSPPKSMGSTWRRSLLLITMWLAIAMKTVLGQGRFDTTSDTHSERYTQKHWATAGKENGLSKPILQRTATPRNMIPRIVAPEGAGSSPVGHPFRFRIRKPDTRK